MSSDVVNVNIMRYVPREVGESFEVFSAKLLRAARITGRDRPEADYREGPVSADQSPGQLSRRATRIHLA
jgi:hypothetical protein